MSWPSAQDQEIIHQVQDLFARTDRAAGDFAAANGLECLKGCGHCCTHPDVHTTVLEMMPMAKAIVEGHQTQAMMSQIQARDNRGVCVLYQPDPHDFSKGRCQAYEHRPGICRLTGFAAVSDKHGRRRLFTCRRIKDAQPHACAKAQAHLDRADPAPLAGDYGLEALDIAPHLGRELLPINAALARALERLSWGS